MAVQDTGQKGHDMKKYYLAYGSNLNIGQMEYRCPNAKPVGISVINDYELLFKGSKTGSYLTIEKHKGSTVPIGVWEVDAVDEEALDRYEGYPSFYYKKDIDVNLTLFDTGRKKKIKAFVYIMHEERPSGVPTRRYLATCLTGYDNFGFEPETLINAYNKSIRRCYAESTDLY